MSGAGLEKHMRKLNLFFRAKIILALALAFFSVRFLSGQIFVGNTPTVSPSFIARVKNAPQLFAGLFRQSKRFLASLPYLGKKEKGTTSIISNLPRATSPPDVVFVPVAKGISTGVSSSSHTKYVKIEKGTTFQVTSQKLPDGREIKVLLPAR